jgi:uncharacterized membrane protein YuzA (DUF378 family)
MMTCDCVNCKGGCTCSKIASVLVYIGGINWGLVGVGMLAGSNWNVVEMLLGSWPVVLAIVYLLVGISTLIKIFGCPCKKCKGASSAPMSSQM